MDAYETFDLLNTKSAEIMEAKNHDYRAGTGDPFANFMMSTKIGIEPKHGIMLRMLDKHARIRTFISKGMLKVKGESVLDAVLDCFNYTILCYSMGRKAKDYGELLADRQILVSSAGTILSDVKCTTLSMLSQQEEAMADHYYDYPIWLCRYALIGKGVL